MLSIFLQGFLLQVSLILALGAQNIFVLNSGLRKQRHLLVAFVCSLCDTLLIFIGVLGVASFFIQFPLLKIGLGVVGVGFLIFYAILKLKEAKKGALLLQTSQPATTTRRTILISLGFSLLNPHVYLDTVVLVGGYSARFENFIQRFYFGAGAATFSIIWFYGLAQLSSLASRFLSHPKSMRFVSLFSGIILVLLSLKLGYVVYRWINTFFLIKSFA